MLKGAIMGSDWGVTAYLDEEDFKLFKIAVEEYGIGDSGLAKKIIGTWLFDHKLELERKK